MSWVPGWLSGLDTSAKAVLSMCAFGGVVAASVRACDGIASRAQLEAAVQRQSSVDAEQDEDLELLFQTQVRLVTSVESLQGEVREVRKDLRALDAGRPLPPLRPAPAPEGDSP